MINNTIKAVQLYFDLVFSKPIGQIGFIGSTLRGGFGYAFRKIACGIKNKNNCRECILCGKCVYSIIFESPVSSDSAIMRKYQYSPHPFVFSYTDDLSPASKTTSNKIVKILVVGKAIDYIPYFIYAMKEFGNNGFGKNRIPFKISRVRDEYGTIFFNDGKWLNPQKYPLIDSDTFIEKQSVLDVSRNVKIDFLTPCRIKFNEHFIDRIEFHVLIRSLLRRFGELSYFFCDKQLDIDYNALISKALDIKMISRDFKWIDFSRYSTRQKQNMKMGGVVGSAIYEGDIKPFLPVLLWGELLHAGKGTSFGLGEFRINSE